MKNCPFCGSNNISQGEVLGKNLDGTFYGQHGCLDCGAYGPEVPVEDPSLLPPDYTAMDAAWDKRTSEGN